MLLRIKAYVRLHRCTTLRRMAVSPNGEKQKRVEWFNRLLFSSNVEVLLPAGVKNPSRKKKQEIKTTRFYRHGTPWHIYLFQPTSNDEYVLKKNHETDEKALTRKVHGYTLS